jgi:hypothetical protein
MKNDYSRTKGVKYDYKSHDWADPTSVPHGKASAIGLGKGLLRIVA